VLTIGVTTCTLTSLIFLPAVLAMVRPGQPNADADEASHENPADDETTTLPFEPADHRRAA
jgi:hypothetical protein